MNTITTSNELTLFSENTQNKSVKINYRYSGLKIAVIMPAYNEEKNIGKTLSWFPNDLSEDLDIIIIDDGSKDKTCEIAQCFNTIIIKHKKNKGNGAAIQTGLEFSKTNKYDIVVIIDADGQHDPRHLPKFIDPIVHFGVDFVIGNRFKHYYDMNIFKKLLSKVMSIFYTILLQKKISDPTMGYRALSSKIINNLKFESNYSITQEMLFKIVPNYSFHEVSTKIYEREFGDSFIKIRKYFKKTFFSIAKFYLFPKFKKMFNRFLKDSDLEKKLSYLMKT